MIYRGTTPTINVEIPFDASLVDDLRISIAQNDKEILVKTRDDCTLDGNTFTVTLTQEETFLLDCSKIAMAQARVLTMTGRVVSSDIGTFEVGKCINNEVL